MTYSEFLEQEIRYSYARKCELEDELNTEENHLHELRDLLENLLNGTE